MSQEKFWEPLGDFINEFKIRGSWGQTGNQSVGLYSYYDALNLATYTFGGNSVQGYRPTTLTCTDIFRTILSQI